MGSQGTKEIIQEMINFYKIKKNGYPYAFIYKLSQLIQIIEDTYSVSNATELQEAIDAIGSDAGTIFMASGTYSITTEITINTGGSYVIYGHGDNTILSPSAGVSVFNVSSSSSVLFRTFKIDTSNYTANTQAFLINETNDNLIRFEDITVDGAGTWGIGIELQSNNCSISNCNITDMGKGIYINNSNSHYISFNTLTGHSDKGLDIDTAVNIFLLGNTCNSNTNYGIYVDSLTYSSISNNTCNSNGKTGMYIKDSSYNTIQNICNGNSENGTYLTGSSHNTVSSNTCSNNVSSSASNTAGIMITANSDYNTITANTCDNNQNGGAGNGYGIRIDTSNCNENVIASNNANGNDIDYEDEGTGTTIIYYVQTNDEIQDAIDAIGSGQGVIKMVEGNISISSTLTFNDINGHYVLEGAEGNTTLVTVGDIETIMISNANYVLLKDFNIDASSLTTILKLIIGFTNLTDLFIDNVNITGNGTNGIGIGTFPI